MPEATRWPGDEAYVLSDVEDPGAAMKAALQAANEDLLKANDFLASPGGVEFTTDLADAQAKETARRMRPIEDAAKLDPADPKFREKLDVLVEEVKANLAADDAPKKPSLDERWRAKRLAKIDTDVAAGNTHLGDTQELPVGALDERWPE